MGPPIPTKRKRGTILFNSSIKEHIESTKKEAAKLTPANELEKAIVTKAKSIYPFEQPLVREIVSIVHDVHSVAMC